MLPKGTQTTESPAYPGWFNGSFNRSRIDGVGVTNALLQRHGIPVFNPGQIGDAINRLNRVD